MCKIIDKLLTAVRNRLKRIHVFVDGIGHDVDVARQLAEFVAAVLRQLEVVAAAGNFF